MTQPNEHRYACQGCGHEYIALEPHSECGQCGSLYARLEVDPVESAQPSGRAHYTRLKVSDAAEALITAKGMITVAARALNCAPNTLRALIGRTPSLAQVLYDEREQMTDVAELSLYTRITAGEGWAVSMYLKTQGKNRGYVERVEHVNADDEEMDRKVNEMILAAKDGPDAVKSLLAKLGEADDEEPWEDDDDGEDQS